jgi:hypothetical protein
VLHRLRELLDAQTVRIHAQSMTSFGPFPTSSAALLVAPEVSRPDGVLDAGAARE